MTNPKNIIEKMQSDPRYTLMRDYKAIISECQYVYQLSVGWQHQDHALEILNLAETAYSDFIKNSESYVVELQDPNSGYRGAMCDFIARVCEFEFYKIEGF